MSLRMIANLMPFVNHPLHQAEIIIKITSSNEKGYRHLSQPQYQNFSRIILKLITSIHRQIDTLLPTRRQLPHRSIIEISD